MLKRSNRQTGQQQVVVDRPCLDGQSLDAAASFTLSSQADKEARPCPLSFSSKEARSDSTNDRHRSRSRVNAA
ncbi:unnamed protein product [Vitrella brassicaformis CCMP3155]|uniref:Uncharacterized protein n=1 Tax=Vitrella brassicaformis (strain CCMP3155) TaxID=1169540 RepID=A0A0G4FKR6_VITBC|nr:unnamed protein product [Vitrella brassicaformis CCMP3155]|eukprot:CEM13937.1 unnamed protein product [Vitrella brassicaformis CCMP3155]